MQLRKLQPLLALLLAALLAGCGGAATLPLNPTAEGPSPTAMGTTPTPAPSATSADTAPAITPSIAVAETEVASDQATTPIEEPTAIALITPPLQSSGEAVLTVAVGNVDGAVGIVTEGNEVRGPRAFRIGADGSIRVLDSLNKRLLFFTTEGRFSRAVDLAEASDPMDFIVNNAGEIFIHDPASARVLRYGRNGALSETIVVNSFISSIADGIMLNANQDLMLTQGNKNFWLVIYQNEAVPTRLQNLIEQQGAVTPRSPAFFNIKADGSDEPFLSVVALSTGASGSKQEVAQVALPQLGPEAEFSNVDRAMNLYFTSMRGDQSDSTVDVNRVLPDGTWVGGARIATTGCASPSWRTVYVDQAGTAWTMCTTADSVTFTRYQLLDANSQALPLAAEQPADVAWRPGSSFIAA